MPYAVIPQLKEFSIFSQMSPLRHFSVILNFNGKAGHRHHVDNRGKTKVPFFVGEPPKGKMLHTGRKSRNSPEILPVSSTSNKNSV